VLYFKGSEISKFTADRVTKLSKSHPYNNSFLWTGKQFGSRRRGTVT
jgi:hypothetical protein